MPICEACTKKVPGGTIKCPHCGEFRIKASLNQDGSCRHLVSYWDRDIKDTLYDAYVTCYHCGEVIRKERPKDFGKVEFKVKFCLESKRLTTHENDFILSMAGKSKALLSKGQLVYLNRVFERLTE